MDKEQEKEELQMEYQIGWKGRCLACQGKFQEKLYLLRRKVGCDKKYCSGFECHLECLPRPLIEFLNGGSFQYIEAVARTELLSRLITSILSLPLC